jgi:hypothetical protein
MRKGLPGSDYKALPALKLPRSQQCFALACPEQISPLGDIRTLFVSPLAVVDSARDWFPSALFDGPTALTDSPMRHSMQNRGSALRQILRYIFLKDFTHGSKRGRANSVSGLHHDGCRFKEVLTSCPCSLTPFDVVFGTPRADLTDPA